MEFRHGITMSRSCIYITAMALAAPPSPGLEKARSAAARWQEEK